MTWARELLSPEDTGSGVGETFICAQHTPGATSFMVNVGGHEWTYIVDDDDSDEDVPRADKYTGDPVWAHEWPVNDDDRSVNSNDHSASHGMQAHGASRSLRAERFVLDSSSSSDDDELYRTPE